MDLLADGVSWFPQEYAAVFYWTKGLCSLVATFLLIYHMSEAWKEAMTLGRRLRYLTLLYVAILLASSSVEQVQGDALVNYRNLGALGASLLLIVTMVVSITESRREHR